MSSSNSTENRRAANAAIKGYVYQFDRTIIEILGASEDAVVTVEGIEDIDIETADETEAVQCKYLEAASFSLALVRKAIIPMVEQFVAGKRLQYRLYLYCQEEKEIPRSLTLADLKECLTEHKRKPPQIVRHLPEVNDEQLAAFAGNLVIITGEEFTVQRDTVYRLLHETLGGSIDDSKDLYYGNALALINNLAVRHNIAERRITRKQFVRPLNNRHILYTRWHREYSGLDAFVRGLARKARAQRLFDTTKRRLVVWNLVSDQDFAEQIDSLKTLATHKFGKGFLRTARPWTVVVEASPAVVVEVKKKLIQDGISINDGYEAISFSEKFFDRPPVLNTEGRSNQIATTSYDIRLLSSKTYLSRMSELEPADTVLVLTSEEPSKYIEPSNNNSAFFIFQGSLSSTLCACWRPSCTSLIMT